MNWFFLILCNYVLVFQRWPTKIHTPWLDIGIQQVGPTHSRITVTQFWTGFVQVQLVVFQNQLFLVLSVWLDLWDYEFSWGFWDRVGSTGLRSGHSGGHWRWSTVVKKGWTCQQWCSETCVIFMVSHFCFGADIFSWFRKAARNMEQLFWWHI